MQKEASRDEDSKRQGSPDGETGHMPVVPSPQVDTTPPPRRVRPPPNPTTRKSFPPPQRYRKKRCRCRFRRGPSLFLSQPSRRASLLPLGAETRTQALPASRQTSIRAPACLPASYAERCHSGPCPSSLSSR